MDHTLFAVLLQIRADDCSSVWILLLQLGDDDIEKRDRHDELRERFDGDDLEATHVAPLADAIHAAFFELEVVGAAAVGG